MEIKPINDLLQIKIEEDGTITSVTGKMGPEVHQAAEDFLNEVHRLSGGERTDTRLAQQHGVLHRHDHDHQHNHIHQGQKG